MSISTDPLFRLGNAVEAGLWIAIGVFFAVFAITRIGRDRAALCRRCWFAFATFVAFGLSDVVELHTGAWWRPWWLFAWKAVCILALVVLLLDYALRRRGGMK